MREVAFLKKNRQKWADFERLLKNPADTDPDKLADLYLQLTDDLAYAQTFYPKSKTRDYLNRLAAETYLALYVNQKAHGKQFLTFFKSYVPNALAKHLPIYLLTAFGLIFFALIGAWIADFDPDFITALLGADYVSMTIQNIKNGHPTAIYGQNKNMLGMFTAIAWNNINVMLKAYASGILLGLLTLYILLFNSLMLGVFFYLFYHYNVADQAWRIIMIHGTIEIWCIILGCTAGFILAQAVIQPGTFTRPQALKNAGLESMRILVGMIPFLLGAAFLEAYVTRYADMALVLNYAIVFATGIIMLLYWGVLPYHLRKKMIASSQNLVKY